MSGFDLRGKMERGNHHTLRKALIAHPPQLVMYRECPRGDLNPWPLIGEVTCECFNPSLRDINICCLHGISYKPTTIITTRVCAIPHSQVANISVQFCSKLHGCKTSAGNTISTCRHYFLGFPGLLVGGGREVINSDITT